MKRNDNTLWGPAQTTKELIPGVPFVVFAAELRNSTDEHTRKTIETRAHLTAFNEKYHATRRGEWEADQAKPCQHDNVSEHFEKCDDCGADLSAVLRRLEQGQ